MARMVRDSAVFSKLGYASQEGRAKEMTNRAVVTNNCFNLNQYTNSQTRLLVYIWIV
jgi:hypothetical protein